MINDKEKRSSSSSVDSRVAVFSAYDRIREEKCDLALGTRKETSSEERKHQPVRSPKARKRLEDGLDEEAGH